MTAGDRVLEESVGRMLSARGLTLALAESCTGGLIGHRITNVSGSSEYFTGGAVVYSNDAKQEVLGVSRDKLIEDGAVSESVAIEMAVQARKLFRADIGLSVTGIAGPEGGTEQKPVGLVFIGFSAGDSFFAKRFVFEGDRLAVKNAGSDAALEILKDYLHEKGEDNGQEIVSS